MGQGVAKSIKELWLYQSFLGQGNGELELLESLGFPIPRMGQADFRLRKSFSFTSMAALPIRPRR